MRWLRRQVCSVPDVRFFGTPDSIVGDNAAACLAATILRLQYDPIICRAMLEKRGITMECGVIVIGDSHQINPSALPIRWQLAIKEARGQGIKEGFRPPCEIVSAKKLKKRRKAAKKPVLVSWAADYCRCRWIPGRPCGCDRAVPGAHPAAWRRVRRPPLAAFRE